MTNDQIDRRLDKALHSIVNDLYFMGPTNRQQYAARLIDRLSYLFTGCDVDAEKLGVHPDPTLFTSVRDGNAN